MGKKKGQNKSGGPSRRGTNAGDRRSELASTAQPAVTPSLLRRNMERSRAKAAAEESQFAKLSSRQLEQMNLIATYTPLQRPIADSVSILTPDRLNGSSTQNSSPDTNDLTLPKKPRWRHDMTLKEVQSNEESVFANWLEEIDTKAGPQLAPVQSDRTGLVSADKLPQPGPTECLLPPLFERNVQVYRQLWRVSERSDILLVLVDARCPLLHLPPSLESHLRRFSRRKVVIVLTKKDVVGEKIANAWAEYLEQKYEWRVVATESYARLEKMEGQGRRARFTPYLSSVSRKALVRTIREVHQDLITPHESVQADAVKLRAWTPPCTATVDWEYLENFDPLAQEFSDEQGGLDTTVHRKSNELLTVGLIGQPNVGKSSLLNALMGSKVVRASRTPGKTKTFQTHRL